MKKVLLFVLLAFVCCTQLHAQNNSPVTINTLRLEARTDFTFDYFHADSINHGLAGKYLNIAINGNITDRFSYHLRQRINSPNSGFANTFFQGTDWAYLNWNLNEKFYLSAGKQVVAIGGWEYDTAPIDIYYGTDFWNHVCCYEMGLSMNYHDSNNWVTFQFSNSPFIAKALEGMYSYNLQWVGNLGFFKPSYSVNMIEYEKGKYINYISLGNKLKFDGVEMYLDIQNRASFEQEQFFGTDFTAIIGVGIDIGEKWIVFTKAGYDRNNAQVQFTANPYDLWVEPGRKSDFESIGFEYYPLGTRNVRLHFCASHNEIDGVHKFQANTGLTWKPDLLHCTKK